MQYIDQNLFSTTQSLSIKHSLVQNDSRLYHKILRASSITFINENFLFIIYSFIAPCIILSCYIGGRMRIRICVISVRVCVVHKNVYITKQANKKSYFSFWSDKSIERVWIFAHENQ